MKTVKKRTVSIIHELIGNEELMTLSELAEKFEVSQRTIRNDLKLINELLKEMDLGKIRLVGGRIICPSSFGQVLKAVPKDDLYTYKLSQEERIEIAASFLINTVEYITMSVIADNLVVSRSTVINDLSKIKAYIGQGNLKVLSHPNKGLRVEGKESDKRLFLMNIKGNGVEKEQKDIVESIVLKQLNLRTDSWQKIREILYEAVYLDQSRLREDSFEKIVLYLGIMIHRNQQGSYIEIQKRQPNSKYRMAQNILIQIAKEYFISHKEDEVQFLSELLICEKFSGYVSEKNEMKEQIRRIESYVEQVLYYLRGEVPEKDYCIGGYGLKEIVQSTVRDNKDSLILNGFSVLVELRDEKVYTDRKWLQFMLGQILSNAVKYAAEDERKIRIFTKKVQSSENSSGEAGIWLWIEDNGIGITEKDLPRIFEKSFTGDNGRKSSSTGMGLYICRRLCEELGHKILAESEPGKYTRIGILFREREADVPVGF